MRQPVILLTRPEDGISQDSHLRSSFPCIAMHEREQLFSRVSNTGAWLHLVILAGTLLQHQNPNDGIRMYFAIVKQYQRTLRALDGVLGKAVAHAETKKFDPDNFCTARLAPDMLPFTRQVQIACDSAKRAVAGLTGKEAPVHEDTEQTMAQLRERIQKCLTYLAGFRAADFAAVTSKTEIKLANPTGKAMYADDALLARSTPNFFFHVVIAYALLRAGGVDIGKQDFLGELPMFESV